MFITEAYAATQPVAEAGSLSGTFIQLGLILLIFYFFLIRPQQRKIKEHAEMTQSLKVGDNVLTNGGIYGKVTKTEEQTVSLEIASGVVIKVDRMSVAGVIVPEKEKNTEKQIKKTVNKKTEKK
jgi:preprotein translocase subunit YajC